MFDNLDELIKLWFAEDIGDGDHTTLSSIPADAMGKQQLIIKEEGIVAGIEVAKRVFAAFDPELKMTQYLKDGDRVKPGDVAFVVEGRTQSLLQTERLMLNIMQRMSGVATRTAEYVKLVEGTKCRVLDTRKISYVSNIKFDLIRNLGHTRLKFVPHIILLFLVTRENAYLTYIGLEKSVKHRVAE